MSVPILRACVYVCVQDAYVWGCGKLLHGIDSFTHPDLMVDNVEVASLLNVHALILTGHKLEGEKLYNMAHVHQSQRAATGYNKVVIIL